MARLIKPDGSETIVKPETGESFTLAELQQIVGGYIQAIYLPSGLAMVMDEDGKRKQRDINNRATVMGHVAGIAGHDFLVGDVLVCDQTEFN